MLKYFETEMRLLHEEAQEFATAYPEQAGMLNLQSIKDRDPYVERLFEGMAYLTAQIRQRIDDDIPHVCESLLGQIWPHFLRPLPSMTIAQFTPRPGQLQQSQTLEKGTQLLSNPVGDDRIHCRFRTTSPVELHPLRISRLDLSEPTPEKTKLTLRFQFDAGISGDQLSLNQLKLYLYAGPAIALELHQALCCDVSQIRISYPDEPTVQPIVIGQQERLSPCHLDLEDMLTPLSGRSFYGFHLLHEYFGFREKYHFINISGLDKISWPEFCHSFDMEIDMNHIFSKEMEIDKGMFQLHCAPAVNLFDSASEPVTVNHKREEYRLLADVAAPEGVEIYSVNQVEGTELGSGSRFTYLPMNDASMHDKSRFFQVSNKKNGAKPSAYISLGGNSNFVPEVLSCEITSCNSDYPREFLVENSLRIPAPDMPSSVEQTNLTRPTKLLRPPERDDYRLSLISHLSLNYSSLTSVDTFKRLLNLYDWTGLDQNKRRIDAITDIQVDTIDRIQKGALLRGIQFTFSMQEENFFSQADIHLFGLVLHHFLGMYASINTFIETKVTCLPSQREFSWQPKFGENFLI